MRLPCESMLELELSGPIRSLHCGQRVDFFFIEPLCNCHDFDVGLLAVWRSQTLPEKCTSNRIVTGVWNILCDHGIPCPPPAPTFLDLSLGFWDHRTFCFLDHRTFYFLNHRSFCDVLCFLCNCILFLQFLRVRCCMLCRVAPG